MKKKILMSLFTIAIVGALIGGGVMALFTDTAISNPNNFSSGTLTITLTNPGTWSAGFSNMKPNQTVTCTLTVESTGSLPLNYTVTTAITGYLGGGATPCFVSNVALDQGPGNTPTTPGTLSAAGGGDAKDTIVVSVKMPKAALNNYQGKSGNLSVTVNATQ